jgi:hypothetical protein
MSFEFCRTAVLVCFACALASAQDPRGNIVGRVFDPSGSPIAGVAVKVTNEQTGVAISATTTETGDYRAPYLIPGIYRVEAEAQGFSRLSRSGVEVRTTETVTLDIHLKLGQVSETVEVTAQTPLLSVSEVSLGQVVDQRRIEELPLFAGNAMDLVHLAPGTVNGTNLRPRKAAFTAAPSQFSSNGGGNNNNDFTIDGIANIFSDGTMPRVAYQPPQTSISEFKIQTAPFDAAAGYTLGSVVNVTIKSGANAVRGEWHHWLANSAFDSRTIFLNRAGQRLPVYQDNRFGGSIGGPVVLPKVYNGRNRTFWFNAFEANPFGIPQIDAPQTVPTPEMRRGDLSPMLRLDRANQVFDPHSTVVAPGGRFRRTPIPGNIIPASRLDPVAQNLLNAFPLPNQPGTADFRLNFFRGAVARHTYWTNVTRFDHAFSENHRMFFRMHRDFWEEDKNRFFGPEFPAGLILNRTNQGAALDDVLVISPSMVLNIRYGFAQQAFTERRVSRGADLAALGFDRSVANMVDSRVATFPRLAVAPWSTMSQWEIGDGFTTSLIHNFNTTLTWTRGKHSLRAGFDTRNIRENRNRFPNATSPDLAFNSVFTRGPLDTSPPPQVGGEVASFLLGIPAGNMAVIDSFAESSTILSFFIQDDIRISRKLTLNIGLRYEVETPTTERFNRAVRNFDATSPNPVEARARAQYAAAPMPELSPADFRVPGGLTFVGTGGNPRGYWRTAKLNLMPRVALSYQLDDKTVVRAGYGMFFAPLGTLYTNTEMAGFSLVTPILATLDDGLSWRAGLANPFPTGLDQPLRAEGGLSTNLGLPVTAFPDFRPNPNAQRWTFGFQRQLPQQFLLEAMYVGNRNTRLNVVRNMNYTPAQFLSTSPVRDQPAIDFVGRAFPNPLHGTNPIFGRFMSRGGLLRPFPQFGNVFIHDPVGYSWFHSLQVRLEKRLARGFSTQLSYTWSKNMEAMEFMNWQDPTPSEVISAMDRTHRITASGIWEIPFGKGRHWGANAHPALRGVFGGWQLNSAWQRQTGPPLGFGNAIFTGDLNNVVLPRGQRGVDQWFDVNAGFERNPALQLASNLRRFSLRFNGIRGPIQDRLDFGLIRNFHFNERTRLQFRAETFNALNFTNLGAPITAPTSGAFGVITAQDPPRSWQFSLKLTF